MAKRGVIRNTKGGPPEFHFKPGQSGNPGGKPVGARNRLNGYFMNCLADDFEKHGSTALINARTQDPMGYIKAIASLMPKQIEASQPLDDVTDAELLAGIAFLRSRLVEGSGEGALTPPESTTTQ